MRFAAGFLAGLAAAWAALAIWQHRAIPDIDPGDVPPVKPQSLRMGWTVPADQFYSPFGRTIEEHNAAVDRIMAEEVELWNITSEGLRVPRGGPRFRRGPREETER